MFKKVFIMSIVIFLSSCSNHNGNNKYSYKLNELSQEQAKSFSNDELLAAAVGSSMLGEEGYDATMGKSIQTFNSKYPDAPASPFSNDQKSIYVRDYVYMKNGSLNKERMSIISECIKNKDIKTYLENQKKCINDECNSQTILMNTKIEEIKKYCKLEK